MLGLILFFFFIWLVSEDSLQMSMLYSTGFSEVKLLNYMHFAIMQVYS